MIIYNGQALESVAPVKIEDVRVSPIARNPQARQRPVRFGADFVRMGGGTRTVTITLAMLTQNTQPMQPIRDPQNLSNFWRPSDHLPIMVDFDMR